VVHERVGFVCIGELEVVHSEFHFLRPHEKETAFFLCCSGWAQSRVSVF
jgi:hypothetical protein